MILFKNGTALRNWLDYKQKKGLKIGFVPTMGALHNGHISLINTSKKINDVTVCSIFVNPTQFNDATDFQKYPITIEQDIKLLVAADCDILFLPTINEIYPDGYLLDKKYELGHIESVLEGKYRPGHYQGVSMVVHRLLNIVLPDNLYLGQKDFQQCIIITKLIELINLQETVGITICPTLREKNGLAMSSRNMRLSENEREKASKIYQTLLFIKENKGILLLRVLKEKAITMLVDAGFKVDYVEIADNTTLSPINDWKETKTPVVLIAAYINDIRLIDNLLLD